MESFGVLRRSEPIVAIGGGVLLDIAGFAASMYRRGVPYIRVPTTLMAMIDACLGVKTGINFNDRRNRLGTYYAPMAAVIDTFFLKTLDLRHMSNGAGEILKLAVVKDAELFAQLDAFGRTLLESRFQEHHRIGNEVIFRAIKGMLEELAENMWELELKRLVDFGHSFSPLVEMKALPALLHGEAVALDVILSCAISRVRGLLPDEDVARVINIARVLNLPTSHPLFECADTLWEALADTMRHRNGNQNLPLPTKIGYATVVNDVAFHEIEAAIAYLRCTEDGRLEFAEA